MEAISGRHPYRRPLLAETLLAETILAESLFAETIFAETPLAETFFVEKLFAKPLFAEIQACTLHRPYGLLKSKLSIVSPTDHHQITIFQLLSSKCFPKLGFLIKNFNCYLLYVIGDGKRRAHTHVQPNLVISCCFLKFFIN